MTAAQDGQADVREAVARWLYRRHVGDLADFPDMDWTLAPPAVRQRLLREADELLAVVGQASKADEALVRPVDVLEAGILLEPLDPCGIPHDRYVVTRNGIARALAARPAVVQPAQPDDDGLRQRVEALAADLEFQVAPRSFHPAGTHADGRSQASADIAAVLRRALDGTSGDQ